MITHKIKQKTSNKLKQEIASVINYRKSSLKIIVWVKLNKVFVLICPGQDVKLYLISVRLDYHKVFLCTN